MKKAQWTLSLVLVILGCLLVPFATLTAWANGTFINTEGYVATVGPLSLNPTIDSTVANFVTTKLFQQVDVQKAITDALPPPAQFLAPPLTERLQDFTREKVNQIVSSAEFNRIWVEANRVVQSQIVKVLTGQGEIILAKEGTVTLDLGALFDRVKTGLSNSGVNLFNNVNLAAADRQIVLLESPALARLQSAVSILISLSFVLPILAFVFLAVAALLSPHRSLTITQIGLGLIGAGAVLVIGIAIGRSLYLGSTRLPVEAAVVIYNTLTNAVWFSGWGIFGFGIALAGGSILGRKLNLIKE